MPLPGAGSCSEPLQSGGDTDQVVFPCPAALRRASGSGVQCRRIRPLSKKQIQLQTLHRAVSTQTAMGPRYRLPTSDVAIT